MSWRNALPVALLALLGAPASAAGQGDAVPSAPLPDVPRAACRHVESGPPVHHQPRADVRHDPSGDPFGRDLPAPRAGPGHGMAEPDFDVAIEPGLARYLAAAVPELAVQETGAGKLAFRDGAVYLNGRPLTPKARRRLRAVCAGGDG